MMRPLELDSMMVDASGHAPSRESMSMVRHELSAFQRQAARSNNRGSISAFPVSRKNYTSTTGFRGASQIPMPATVSDEEDEAGDSMPEWGGRTVLPKIPSAIS